MFNNSKHGYKLLASFEKAKHNDAEYLEIESFTQENANMDQTELSAHHVELPCKSIYGLMLAFISCSFFATGSLFVKLCQGSLDSYQIALIRSLVQLLFCVPTLAYYRLGAWHNLSTSTRITLIARGSFGGIGLMLVFYSFQNLPLGDASAIIISSAVYTTVLARILLNEKFDCLDAIVLILTIVGVVLIAQPTVLFSKNQANVTKIYEPHLYETNRSIVSSTSIVNVEYQPNAVSGIVAAVSASFVVACAHITLRKLPSIHYSIPLLYLSVGMLVTASFTLMITKRFLLPSEVRYWVFAFLVGIFGYGGQICLTMAYQMENAGPVAIVRQCDIVLAYIFQVAVFHDAIQIVSCIGGVLIIGGSLTLATKKYFATKALLKIQPDPVTLYSTQYESKAL